MERRKLKDDEIGVMAREKLAIDVCNGNNPPGSLKYQEGLFL